MSTSAGETGTCVPNLCPGGTDNQCCKPKAAGACTNCVATADCETADKMTGTCSDTSKPQCCKPKCAADKCMASCTGTFETDSSASVKDCPTGKKKCCKATGGTPPGAGGGTTPGATYELGPLSPVGTIDIPTLIGYVIIGALGIIGSIALLMFVYGGFLMLISQGDAAKVKKGKDALVWAAAGLVVIFGSYIFVSYILTSLTQGGAGGG